MALFIGGVADGQRHVVADDQNYVHIIHPQPELKISSDLLPEFEIKTDLYKREKFYGRNKHFSIFLKEGLNADDCIKMLIEGYKP